jgi:desulfoferrodoxin (superoxide reductase-like protein)
MEKEKVQISVNEQSHVDKIKVKVGNVALAKTAEHEIIKIEEPSKLDEISYINGVPQYDPNKLAA